MELRFQDEALQAPHPSAYPREGGDLAETKLLFGQLSHPVHLGPRLRGDERKKGPESDAASRFGAPDLI